VQLLFSVEQVLAGSGDQDAAKEKMEKGWEWAINDYGDRVEELSNEAMCALLTAVEAMYVALGNDRWKGLTIRDSWTDADLDAWTSDAPKWAAIALTGSVWKQMPDSSKRREFWKWWLTEAIPSAYRIAR
jgi:hypothetical protein